MYILHLGFLTSWLVEVCCFLPTKVFFFASEEEENKNQDQSKGV